MEITDETGACRGTWVFGWVLQGRAVQDVLWDERTRLRGTRVRMYDPAADSWRITWFGPRRSDFRRGQGQPGGR